ncbi:MAG: hypothetical protein M3O85_09210 [Acidobacteriota bacterium]|nr:hypothetical protein [Acidobacteriota bacterium]
MIELIRQSAVPANMMRTAAKGALAVPSDEMIEILVYLASHPLFGEQAKMTLASWDEKSAIEVAANPKTPWEVLEYLVAPENRRPKLVPALLENPAVREVRLQDMAQTASRELVDLMLASPRVRKSKDILHALGTNQHLSDHEVAALKAALASLGEDPGEILASTGEESGGKTQYEIEHAAEIAAEEGKAFELVGSILEDDELIAAATQAGIAPAAAAPEAPMSEEERNLKMRAAESKTRERQSTLQKISKLKVGDRVQLAMKGSKDERFILIRDGSKVVSSAVLQSPKLSDVEVETFAGMKNVQESVLRDIARSKKFVKNYSVIRALVSNPRCPLDIGLTLMNHLLVNDLKALSMNKNVPDTLRKLGMKKFKEKSAPPGGKKSE